MDHDSAVCRHTDTVSHMSMQMHRVKSSSPCAEQKSTWLQRCSWARATTRCVELCSVPSPLARCVSSCAHRLAGSGLVVARCASARDADGQTAFSVQEREGAPHEDPDGKGAQCECERSCAHSIACLLTSACPCAAPIAKVALERRALAHQVASRAQREQAPRRRQVQYVCRPRRLGAQVASVLQGASVNDHDALCFSRVHADSSS